jgi:hypothetical protein
MMSHRHILTASLCASLLLAVGCSDDDDCLFGAAELQAALELRNPATGLCEAFSSGGGGGGCGTCGAPCDEAADPIPNPDWAQCYVQCEGLDEGTCLGQSACRAAYTDGVFHECWSTAPSGPIQGGDCTTFDAQTCSQHDDCVAHHATGAPVGAFIACGPELTGCFGQDECGPDETCNAGDVCLPPPGCDGTGPCPDVCYGYCIPDNPGDPGSCVGEVTCESLPPACPTDTVPGRKDGCWTGFCIPIAQCDQLPACGSLSESGCVGRSDCAPIYEGINCSCTDNACTCQDWIFDVCTESN